MTIDSVKNKILSVTQKHDVIKVALFGSILTDEFSDNSDIDILIEFEGRKSLFDLIRLEEELEQVLHRKVDIITYNSLHPLLRDKILKEQVIIT